jgi:hypothetical protein
VSAAAEALGKACLSLASDVAEAVKMAATDYDEAVGGSR